MLTPAEELGLSGLSLASRVRKAFHRIPEDRLLEVIDQVRQEARRRHLVYLRDGQEEVIHVLPLPITVLPEQVSYLHYVSQTINNALKRLPELYVQNPAAREVLRVSSDEEKWLLDYFGPNQLEHNPVFSRLDAMVDFISPMWKDSLKFVEPNMGGIGGLHMVPTAEEIFRERVLPVLLEQDRTLLLETGRDIRELLMQEMLDHLQALGRGGGNICFVEPKYASSGPDEQEELAQYYHRLYGTKVMHADPAELRLEADEVTYQGERVDLAYRDYPTFDLIELDRQGVDIRPMRKLFATNRLISSIASELDQKSCWEIFTDPQYADHFSSDERQVFRRHVLWTRLVSDRNTLLPDGRHASLMEFLRDERERLVLKPNRSYGGEGVAIGHVMSQADWERLLEKAIRDPERWVAQRLASIPVSEFPVLGPDGKLHFEPFYTVMGFAATQYGLSILGRASQKQVVNVAQRGGLCVILPGRAERHLIGTGFGR